MERVEEKRLLRAAQQGNTDAFAALYRENVQRIFRYIFHRVNDRHLAEDLTGDVFMRALQGIASYTDQGKPFVAWLYRIAHDRVVDHYRKVERRPVETDVDEAPIPVEHNMDERLLRRQAAAALREALATLTSDQQQVIILRFIEGLPTEEVASIMGKNGNAIKALQHRALRALAGRLERAGFDITTIMAGLT